MLLNAAQEIAGVRLDANLPSTVLRRYRVVLDYPAGRFTIAATPGVPPHGTRLPAAVHPQTGLIQVDVVIDLEKSAELNTHDVDIVGLTLRPHGDGSFTVLAVSKKNGQPVVDGVQAGDKLLQVGALQTKGATMGTVVDALRGKAGDVRTLVVERAGKSITIEARVERLL